MLRGCSNAVDSHDGLQALQLLFHIAEARVQNVGFAVVALADLSTEKSEADAASFHVRHKMVFQEVKFWSYVTSATIGEDGELLMPVSGVRRLSWQIGRVNSIAQLPSHLSYFLSCLSFFLGHKCSNYVSFSL